MDLRLWTKSSITINNNETKKPPRLWELHGITAKIEIQPANRGILLTWDYGFVGSQPRTHDPSLPPVSVGFSDISDIFPDDRGPGTVLWQ